jgi:hypothetical protein
MCLFTARCQALALSQFEGELRDTMAFAYLLIAILTATGAAVIFFARKV